MSSANSESTNHATGNTNLEEHGSRGQYKKRLEEYPVMKFVADNHLKANGSNFVGWKRLQINILRSNKWERYALGLVHCPDAELHPEEYDTCVQIDNLVLSQLGCNMDIRLFGEIASDDMTSAQLWKAILAHFEEHSDLTRNIMHSKLYGKRVLEGESMKDHIAELRKLKADYANMGGELTQDQWHTIVSMSLGGHSQWNQMDLYADSIEDPEKLIHILELKEIRGFGKVKTGEADLQMKQKRRGRTRNDGKAKGLCTNCGRGVHTIERCWAPGRRHTQAPSGLQDPLTPV